MKRVTGKEYVLIYLMKNMSYEGFMDMLKLIERSDIEMLRLVRKYGSCDVN